MIARLALFVALGGTAMSLLGAAPAGANGPCGQDLDGNTACAVNSPFSANGSLITDNESDYYVFHAPKGTELSVSITDTENPQCGEQCGSVKGYLLEAKGNEIDSDGWSGSTSSPHNGIPVPLTLSHTVEATGTYYLLVGIGELGRDENGQRTAVPYTLTVSASPAVGWPPARSHIVKRCTIKRVRRHHHVMRTRVCHTIVVHS
jgi:hypothetical protein